MLIQAANAANAVREAGRFHVDASLDGVDWVAVVDEMDETLSGIAEDMAARYREKAHLDLLRAEATFVDERTVEVDGERVSAEKVVVATGSRPLVPPVDGLAEVEYLTSREALYLRELPDRLVVLGGGYIAVELGYVFESMGTDVAIVEMMDSLVPREDPAVAEAFTEIAAERHDVYTGYRATEVREESGGDDEWTDGTGDGERVVVRAESTDGEEVTVAGDELLVAVGRRPNTDGLGLEAAGIETDDRGFVETNQRLETTAANVWAQGDVAGNQLFKHSGDYETQVTVANVVHGDGRTVDYTATPHAIFAEPQIAGVGATETDLQDEGRAYVVGSARFADTAMGRAKKLERGFAKVLASPDGDLLGCHVVGEEASTLIHEAVVPMRRGDATVAEVAGAIHAHPTLSKVMEAAFRDVPV